jgi:hypothetical protein
MRSKRKRVLWLLNHKTLMPYEAGLLQDLGFEVFTPKIVPDSEEYRSCIVDDQFDAALSIPRPCLDRLNAFNFYGGQWPSDVVALLNRYFGTAFVVAHARQIPEAVLKFEGNIAFRTFGLDGSRTYGQLLRSLFGDALLARIYGLGQRFWFAQGYEQLQECEPPLLARRAVFLPVGLPASSWRRAHGWRGSTKKILFICRNVVSSRYYSNIYQQFKRDFGDLPHVIVGAQDVPVDDPNVVGYVSDDELRRFYLDCAVLYYYSREPRHVHYSPIEASINGMPVVFYRDSLLGRLTGRPIAGGVDTAAQARGAIERILAGDQAFIDEIRHEQQQLAHHFSDAYCRPVWQHAVVTSGLFARPAAERQPALWVRETLRPALAPLARAMTRLRSRRDPPWPPFWELQEPVVPGEDDGSLLDGIDFRAPRYPKFVCLVSGLSSPETFGRWSLGPKITFLLSQFLEHSFRLVIVGGAYGNNIGAPIRVRIGRATQIITFPTAAHEPTTVTTEFSLRNAANIIEFLVPFPTVPPADDRAVGIGLVHLRVEPLGNIESKTSREQA